MNTHTLKLTDRQAAMLLNAVQFAVVSIGRVKQNHQSREYMMILEAGWEALASIPTDIYEQVHQMLTRCAETFEDPIIQIRDQNGKPKPKDKDIPFPGYVPETGPFSATSRAWDDLTDSEQDDFQEYYDRKGFYHEHDPRGQD